MMKLFLSLIIYVILLTAKGATAQPSPFKDTARFVMFPYDQQTTWCFPKGSATTLDKKELRELGEMLKQAAESSNAGAKNPNFRLLPMHQYYFQLVAIINDKGEKEVRVNGLCEVIRDDWRKNIIAVMDGGNCYFTIKINLNKKSYYELLMNGYA